MQAGDFGAEIDRQEAQVLRGVTAAALLDTSAKAELEASGEIVAAAAMQRDLIAKIERDDTQMSCGVALARQCQVVAKSVGDACGHFVGALALLAEQIERAAESAACAKFVDTTA